MIQVGQSANKICSETWTRQDQLSHSVRLTATKSQLDTSAPPVYQHLVYRAKKEQMTEEWYTQIEHENRLLLKKMSKIMRTSSLDKFQTPPLKAEKSLNAGIRKRELKKIMDENQAILKRIQNRKPVYNRDTFTQHAMVHDGYRSNIKERSARLLPTLLNDPRDPRAKSAPERGRAKALKKPTALEPIKDAPKRFRTEKQPLQRPKRQESTTKASPRGKKKGKKAKASGNRLSKGGFNIDGTYVIVTVEEDKKEDSHVIRFSSYNMDEGSTHNCVVEFATIEGLVDPELVNLEASARGKLADTLVPRLNFDGDSLVFNASPDWKAPQDDAGETETDDAKEGEPEPSDETQLSMTLKVDGALEAGIDAVVQVFAGDKFVFKTEVLSGFTEGEKAFEETCNLQTKDKAQSLQLRLMVGDDVLATGDFTLGSLTEGTPTPITLSDEKYVIILVPTADKATVSIDLDEEDNYDDA